MAKGDRFRNITILRAIVILIVVFGHSMSIYCKFWGIFTPAVNSVVFHTIWTYLGTFLMPLFILLSGYLFFYVMQDKGKYAKFSSLFKDKALRLLVPYIVTALFYVVPIRYAIGYKGYVNDTIFNVLVVKILLMLDAGNLWFLGMLFGVFMMAWFFERKTNISALIKIGIYTFLYFASFLIPPYLQISNALYYLIFFYFGGLAFQYRNRVKPSIPVIFVFLAVNLIFYRGYMYLDSIDGLIFSIFKHVSLFLSSVSGMLFYYFLVSRLVKFTNNMTLAHFLDKNSYGIYLFHESIIYIVYFYMGKRSIAPILMVLMCFVLSFSVALAITAILRRCGLSLVIGEYKKKVPI